MRSKTIVNSKGEPQKARIEIQIEGSGGELGEQAVTNLTMLISGLKDMETAAELKEHIFIIYGYAVCCQQCGFVTKKSMDDLMQMVELLADNELIRIKEG